MYKYKNTYIQNKDKIYKYCFISDENDGYTKKFIY